MASRNLKPKNSSDSEGETEWTFIDSDEGTIETNKDCVTYRKPTYSEILKGVVAEDLVEEVESEPEFEVLASFKFRPKGESFSLGSSASKVTKNTEAQGKESKQEGDDSPIGDDSSSSDDGIMIISTNADEARTSEAPSQASDDDDDYNKIDETNAAGSFNDEPKDNKANADENVHDDDDDDDFVIADETESDFEEATMDDTAEPNDEDEDDDDDDDDDDGKQDVESDEEELTKSTANTLNASITKDESHDEDSNSEISDDGLLGIHKGGICDNPEKDLDWDSLTFQLLSTLPRMNDSATTLGDDNQNPSLLDSMAESIHDSDSENHSHSSYAAVSQDDSSSFDELSDPADVNRDLNSLPIIPKWLFNADKSTKDTVESFDDDSDYIISDIEELDFEERTLIPQWFYDPNHEVEVVESVDDDFEFLEKDPDVPRWLYDPSYKVEDLDDVDFQEPNPIIPRWIFDPNYKIPDLDETYADDTDYTDSEYERETDDDDSMTLPRWLFDKNFKPPIYEDDEEGFAWPSQLFVDIPTFIILLCLTTALGFSIGHGLTLYFNSQGTHRNAKLQDMQATKQFPLEDLGLTAEEIAKIDLLRLEDELEQQKNSDMLSEHLRFDLRELYKSLKEKHYRLLRSQKNTEDRLHISKTMSWYWRMKYDEEKRRNEVMGVPKNLRPKNFSDMANLARKTKLAKKWRRLYKKNDTAPRLGKSFPLNANLKWLVNPFKAALKQHQGDDSRYLVNTMTLLKKNVLKKFRNRWTQDSKKLQEKSCSSRPNKNIRIKKKTAISSPFGWVNSTRKCKRVNRSNILGRCLIKESPLVKNEFIKPTIAKPAKKDIRRKANYLKSRPCFAAPKNDNKRKTNLNKKAATSFKKISREPRRKSAQRANKEEKVRKEKIKKRELKKKAMEIKKQVDELKAVLAELRRERRRAEREKAKIESSWRKLKRQRLAFEKEKKENKKNDKKKVKKVKTKLKREKTRLKTWKNVAKRAQKKAEALHKDLRRVHAAKQKLGDIKHIKKDLRLEKRKLREQQKNLKSIKQQLRKEHRNYARERWKTKKKRRELEKQSFNKSERIEKKSNKVRKQEKKNKNYIKTDIPLTDQPSTKQSQNEKNKNKKKHKARKKFWEDLEKSLYHWADKVNKTIQSHRYGRASKIWSKLRRQFDKLVSWTTGKSSKPTVPKKKTTKGHQSKTTVKIQNPVYEKILAEQMMYDEEKRNRQKDSENQWNSKGPVVIKKKKKKKKERKKKNPETLLRQKQRKQRRKYQRELERLQQWALQMNEKKLEHERIYRKKEKATKRFKARWNPKPSSEKGAAEGRGSFSSSRALVSVQDSNNTLMLLLQPQIKTPTDHQTPKTNNKQKPEHQDQESVIRDLTKSQVNYELKKKKTGSSLTVPLLDDAIKLPDDVSKGIGVTSFEEESQEPTPPSFSPTFYKDFPILRIIDKEKRKKDGPVSVADTLSAGRVLKGPENARYGVGGQRSVPWYMRRAEQRDNLRNTNPALTMFPRPIGPLKSDGTWFFHRSNDRALQRELFEPLNRQSARDGFQNKAWRSRFHRRSETNNGKWVFERASDRAEQRSNNEPWYMRRAEGREEDREENRESWFVERGFDRDMMHYDEDDEYDDLMNDYDYDDYADRYDESYDTYEGPWL